MYDILSVFVLMNKQTNQTVPFKLKEYEFNHFERKIDFRNFSSDRRMRFRNSKDPIYIAFDFLDKQPINKLAKEFFKDTIKDTMSNVMKFISIVKG